MRIIDRRTLLIAGAGLSAALAWPALAQGDGACTARIRQGVLRGIRRGGVDIYLGVPYAGSPAGANRFKAAPAAPSWLGERDATRLGHPAMQPPGGMYGLGEPPAAEDCLVLDIWTPAGGGHGKPVMVYSHGGGFTTGSGGSVMQDGANLAREQDVVVVETNHRLGLFGFLYLDALGGEEYRGSGNRGIQDIAVALRWVHENIAAFGGDPGNVMIFGESGGGMKTSCLYAMPQAAPFFHKASIESGPGIRIGSPDIAADTTERVLKELGIARTDWRKLIDVPAEALLAAQLAVAKTAGPPRGGWGGRKGLGELAPGAFGPVLDGAVMPHHPFDPGAPAISRGKPLMVGGNEDEQMFFAMVSQDKAAFSLDEAALQVRLKAQLGDAAEGALAAYRADRPGASPSDLYFAITSDLFSGQGSNVIAERKAMQGGAPAYRYVLAFDQGSPMPGTDAKIGAMHALDIAFKFDNMNGPGGKPSLAGPRPERFAVGKAMSSLWAGFARTGKPAAPGVPAWPAYTIRDRATMYIDTDCHVEMDPHAGERRFWEARAASG